MKKSILIQLVILLVGGLIFAGYAAAASNPSPPPAKPVKLRAVTAFPKHLPQHAGFRAFVKMVEQELKDYVTIEYLGGSEVIPSFDQPESVSKGVVDLADAPASYIEPLVSVTRTIGLSKFTPWEDRERGVYDKWREVIEDKLNIFYLCGDMVAAPYHLWTNFEVKTLDDLKGKIFRAAPAYVALYRALGIQPVTMSISDIYTAMERGVVNGFAAPSVGATGFGWQEVTKYRINPGFYRPAIVMLLNLDKWKQLPAYVQGKLMEIAQQVERDTWNYHKNLIAEETAKQKKAGMTILELPPAVAEEFLRIAYDEAWKEVLREDPELGPVFKNLLR